MELGSCRDSKCVSILCCTIPHSWLTAPPVQYLRVSLGRESGHSLAVLCSETHMTAAKVSAGLCSLLLGILFQAHVAVGRNQCRVLVFLLAGLFSAPRSCSQFLAMWPPPSSKPVAKTIPLMLQISSARTTLLPVRDHLIR